MVELAPCAEIVLHRACVDFLHNLRKRGFMVSWQHSANEGKRTPRYAQYLKSMGMTKGHPDLDIYLPNGKTVFVELKSCKKGAEIRLEQEARHFELTKLGFNVHIIQERTPYAAQDRLREILNAEGMAV